MTRVPTRKGALQQAVPAPGSRVKLVYSPEEALEAARSAPDKNVVFFGVGFETTIPGIALTVRRAAEQGIHNFSVLSAFWLVPPPLKALASADDLRIEGFLYPGHVSAIIGIEPYRFLAEQYGIPGAVAGFEPGDILLAISAVLDQMLAGRPDVANPYARVVRRDGNPAALALMDAMLKVEDALWRGLGLIPRSGLRLKPDFQEFDAGLRFPALSEADSGDLPGCRCGEILQGRISPPECPLFGKRCRPESPQGPCMVSYEGSCLAYFKYRT
jgi:hydrogenase expression/formation protein HypD